MSKRVQQVDPYRVFFPIGVLSSLIGVGIWLFQDFEFASSLTAIHSKLMMGGFLWCFIIGFLMTAIPKMSKTKSASLIEIASALVIISMQIIFSWQVEHRFYFGTNALLIVFIIVYAGRRLIQMTTKPPVFFSHIGLGLLAALLGCYFYATNQFSVGLLLYYVAPVLLLVLGIGTRFFSFLSGLPSEFETSTSKPLRLFFHCSAVGVLLLLYLAGIGFHLAYLGMAFLSTSYVFLIWKVQRASDRLSTLKYAVRFVAAMIPLSFLLIWIQPVFLVTWLHLLFVGCFSLLTYSVATRVTLAHGSYSLDLETRSRSLLIFFICICLALFFRLAYGLNFSASRQILLNIAISLWLLAVIIWSYSFLPKMLIRGSENKPSC